jgi:NADPH2:quinone reductase
MRRISLSAFGGPERLIVDDLSEDLRPGPGQVLVDVEAAGINYIDVYQRNGAGNVSLPYTPGLEGVGRVRELGERPTDAGPTLRVGQRIAWIDVPGSYADRLVVPVTRAIVVPDLLTTVQALLFQPLTAQYLVTEYRHVRPGDRVLVHSAAGGVGQLLVRWLKHLGAWVVGTTSSDAKVPIVSAAGADAVINYGHDYSFLNEVLELTDGRGVDLAFDAVGAATLTSTVKALARGGSAVSFGRASGPAPAISPDQLREKCTRLAGGSIFTYVAADVELQQRAAAVIEGIHEGWLHVEKGAVYDLSETADAHRALENRATHGKVFLRAGEGRHDRLG